MTQTDQPSADHRPAYLRGHVPVLDGVRGLAILLVVALHVATGMSEPTARFDWWVWQFSMAGWTGVELFFVLSGFLITGILSDSKEAPNYFKSFYGRRVLRIFPLYYAFLIVMLIVWSQRRPEAPFGESAWWHFAYLQNYLKEDSGIRALGVTWSLAIEEQFYMVWPMLVYLLSRKAMIRLCVAIVLLSPVLRAVLYYQVDPWWMIGSYAVTPTHLDGLTVGALIALVVRTPGGMERLGRWLRITLPVGVIGTLACMAAAGDARPRIMPTGLIGMSFFALMFGSLLLLAIRAEPGSILHRIFASRFLRVWGKYSYAVYLLHIPAISVARNFVAPALWSKPRYPTLLGSEIPALLAQNVIVAAISLGFAWLSWHLLERHFLALKDRFAIAKPVEHAERQ